MLYLFFELEWDLFRHIMLETKKPVMPKHEQVFVSGGDRWT